MKNMVPACIALFLFPLLANSAESAKTPNLDSIQILKIALQDERAVINDDLWDDEASAKGNLRTVETGGWPDTASAV